MNSIKAIWTNGQIVPAEPVDWPEGSQLVVEPLARRAAEVGLTEDEWRDDPEAVAAWIAAVEQIEPLVWHEGKREAYESYRAKQRQFNIEAVRNQMYEVPEGDAE